MSSKNCFAVLRSAVPKPSVNLPYIETSRSRASSKRPRLRHSRARLIAVRSCQEKTLPRNSAPLLAKEADQASPHTQAAWSHNAPLLLGHKLVAASMTCSQLSKTSNDLLAQPGGPKALAHTLRSLSALQEQRIMSPGAFLSAFHAKNWRAAVGPRRRHGNVVRECHFPVRQLRVMKACLFVSAWALHWSLEYS